LKKRITVITGVIAGIVAATALFGAVATKPAEALPGYKSTCSSCHSATPSGTVTAVPSKTTLAPGEAYTVTVTIPFTNTGMYGAWIHNSGNTTSVSAGPNATGPVVVNMTAPSAAGPYTYTAFGVRSTTNQSTGEAASTTYQITVQSNGGGGGSTTVAPTTVAPNAASVKKGKTVALKFRVNDTNSGAATATVTIRVKNAAGKVVKTINAGAKPVNAPQSASFKCTLKKGKYKFFVSAKDSLGLAAGNVASNKLTVK
jgi:hypothetical protein